MTIDAESGRGEDARGLGWRVVPLVFAECRPIVLAMFALRFLAGASLGRPGGWGRLSAEDWGLLVVGVVAWVAATGFVYLLNGVSDIPGDRLNGSIRPLASGRLPVRVAVGWCIAFAVVAVVLSAVLGFGLLICTVAMIAFGWLYSAGRHAAKQRVWSASLVIFGGGIATYLGGAFTTGNVPTPETIAIAVLMAAWMAVAGNTKDLGDVAGDRVAGRRTLPVSLGIRPAAWATAVGCCAVGVAGLFVPSLTGRVVAVCLLAAALVMLGLAAYGRSLGTKRMYAVFMVSQVVSNLVIVVMA
ncbi:UbiA family prenyltransferase [Humibacter antri]